MTAAEAMAFVRRHGVVLMSATGAVPTLTHAIAGAPIRGSWWGHPKGREIFRVLQNLRESPDILVCRIVDGKITFVHKRLWPALVRVAHRFAPREIAQVHEQHTASGRHVTHDVSYPDWVLAGVATQARALDEAEALAALGPWATKDPPRGKKKR